METVTHPKHHYRISRHTGKRLPSKHVIRQKIERHERDIELLQRLLAEHLEQAR